MNSSDKTPFGKRYEIIENIGHGGMGRVYKVFDTLRNETLALKELSRRHINSKSAILGFKNEFRIMSEFRHPNMVKVFEFGMNLQNIPFITMEFIAGKDLSEVSNIAYEQIIDILIELCQVLACIHSRLYIHRDLKPDNIKLTDDGIIKVLDYGLMSQLGVQTFGQISGTYYYLAPETITGGTLDASTDLYSLGIIGYELLTGQCPFTGSRKEILHGHLKQKPKILSELRPDVPESINSIIMKMLEKDKYQRYRNCSDALEDLQHLTGKIRRADTNEVRKGYLYSSKIIGRTRELEFFNISLQELKNKKSSCMFIGALPGMGKTRLLSEMKTLVELEGFISINLNSQIAGDRIYGWITGLIKQILPLCDSNNIQKYTDPMVNLCDDIIELLISWLESIAKNSPLVLFLDDLQWADAKSLQVLNELIRNQQKINMLIIGGFRNNEVDKTSLLWHTIEEELTQYLELVPLNFNQTSTLINTLLYPSSISEEFSNYCFNNCGGNIFDLIEFLRYMIDQGHLTKTGRYWTEPISIEDIFLPENIEERLILRTNTLSLETRKIADAAAVIGDDLNLEIWQTICLYDEKRFFQAIDELMEHQIIIKVNNNYQFSHDKIKTAFYYNLETEQRKDYHLKTAQFLENKLTKYNQNDIPSIAFHYVRACHHNKAIEFCLKAGKIAENNNAEWEAFDYYRNAARFLEEYPQYPDQESLLLEIYEKPALFSSAVWIDASTCLEWLQKAINHYIQKKDMEKVFGLCLSYVVSASITGNYNAARVKIPEIIQICNVKQGTIQWAVLFGAGVCLIDWYQGYQQDCFSHAVCAIDIFENHIEILPDEAWPAYCWSLFWRDKARAYLGKPVEMSNVEKIRQLTAQGKSDQTIYWHTLTAVTARAAFTGRWEDLLAWKHRASHLSKEMGKIYWFECWISHSYLYGAIFYGDFSQLENHIDRVVVSPDPYQVRLAYLFQGMLSLSRKNYEDAKQNIKQFLDMEEKNPDNSYAEGFIYMARTCIAMSELDEAELYINKGFDLVNKGPCENGLYQLQFLHLKAELAIARKDFQQVELWLGQSLEMAKISDNPIQQGFILKTWGNFYLVQNNIDKAKEQFIKSRDMFLFLGNKYQAGQVIAIMESIAQDQIYKKLNNSAPVIDNNISSTIIEKDQDDITFVQDKNILNTQYENTKTANPKSKKTI